MSYWSKIFTISGPTGPTGDIGSDGSTGYTGETGTRGATWFYGATDPLSTISGIKDGDLYFHTVKGNTYVYIESTETWELLGVLFGPQGDTGPTGADSTVTGPTGPQGDAGVNGISSGLILFMDSAGGAYPQTGTLSTDPNLDTQTTITASGVTNTNNVLLATFTEEVGTRKTTIILEGYWDFNVYFSSATSDGVTFHASVYYVDSDGTSNPIAISEGTSQTATPLTPDIQDVYNYSLLVPYTVLPDLTKRIQVRIYGNFSGNNRDCEIELRNGTISHVHTTLAANPGEGATGPTGPASSGKICQAYLANNQTITTNTDTIVNFVDDLDPNNWWDATNHRFQPNISGYYLVSSSVWWAAGSTGTNQTNLQFRKNGSGAAIVQAPITTTVGNSLTVTKIFQMNGSTDYIDVTAYTANTPDQSIQSGNGSWFSAALQ